MMKSIYEISGADLEEVQGDGWAGEGKRGEILCNRLSLLLFANELSWPIAFKRSGVEHVDNSKRLPTRSKARLI